MEEVPSTEGFIKRKKICLVCGDVALGHNFNAITCESCKAFFRRNALKEESLKCPYENNCRIDRVSRKVCQLCRLKKCFTVGMKKEYIRTEEDNKELRRRIKENRVNRRVKEDERAASSEEEGSSKRARLSDTPTESQPSCSKYFYPVVSPEQTSPYTSPAMPEPSSPVGSVVTEQSVNITYCNTYDSNRSRPVEVYQLLKPKNEAKYMTLQNEARPGNCSIIQNMLSTDHNNDTGPAEEGDRVEVRVSGAAHGGVEKLPREVAPSRSRQTPLLSSLMETHVDPPVRSPLFEHVPLRVEPDPEVSRSSRHDMSKSMELILAEAIKLEYEAYRPITNRFNSRELNEREREKLSELIVANKALLAPVDDDVSSLVAHEDMTKGNLGSRPMLKDVLNLTAVAIRRLIKMAKKVNAFKNMCQEDQVALLKGGCTEMMILRSAMTYDSDRGSWKIPHSRLMNIRVDVLKEAGGKVFEEHQRFLQTFDSRWRSDENIMLILSAITLFNPDRPMVVHSDVIKYEQNCYYYLLQRYLESKYPGCEARSTYLKLINKIMELQRLNEDHVRVYMQRNPEVVEPLLIEIFDLNPH